MTHSTNIIWDAITDSAKKKLITFRLKNNLTTWIKSLLIIFSLR